MSHHNGQTSTLNTDANKNQLSIIRQQNNLMKDIKTFWNYKNSKPRGNKFTNQRFNSKIY